MVREAEDTRAATPTAIVDEVKAVATVYLVACISRKRSEPARAEALYDSPLFAKSARLARLRADKWFILSAKYGLVSPQAVIAPYDETLNKMGVSQRRARAGAERTPVAFPSPGRRARNALQRRPGARADTIYRRSRPCHLTSDNSWRRAG